jgi:hypothetical protein
VTTPASLTKPLQWRQYPDSFPSPVWVAETPFGSYTIEETNQSDSSAYEVRWLQTLVAIKDSLSEAQEAAQHDYADRKERA